MGSRYTACLLGRLEMEIRGARSCTLLFMLEEEGFTMKKRQRLSGGMTAAATSCITSSAAAAGSNVAGGGGGKRKDAAASTEPSADDMAMVRDGGGAPQAEAVHHQRPGGLEQETERWPKQMLAFLRSSTTAIGCTASSATGTGRAAGSRLAPASRPLWRAARSRPGCSSMATAWARSAATPSTLTSFTAAATLPWMRPLVAVAAASSHSASTQGTECPAEMCALTLPARDRGEKWVRRRLVDLT